MVTAKLRGALTLTLLGAAIAALPANAQAVPGGPDRGFRTPIAQGAASAHSSISGSKLSTALRKLFRSVGRSGAFVLDASNNQVLFSRKAGRPRILASNSKLFTTSTALARFEPQNRLHTTAWSIDEISDGISQGLYVRGGGDPTLSASGLAKLADRVHAAGVVSVQGPLRYDDSFLDQMTGIPQHGITSERIGTLSGLTIDGGAAGDPAKGAAQRFRDALRRDGVGIGNSVTPAAVPQGAIQVADFGSPSMADLVQDTNVPSNNFFAEMLLKDVGGQFGDSGSTLAGAGGTRPLPPQWSTCSIRCSRSTRMPRPTRSSTRAACATPGWIRWRSPAGAARSPIGCAAPPPRANAMRRRARSPASARYRATASGARTMRSTPSSSRC